MQYSMFKNAISERAHRSADVDKLAIVEDLGRSWGWSPYRATHVLPKGTIAIQYTAGIEKKWRSSILKITPSESLHKQSKEQEF